MDASNSYMVLLHLAGAITLLLWAVRMVRTGVERSQEPALKRLLRGSRDGQLRAAAIGAGSAMLLRVRRPWRCWHRALPPAARSALPPASP